MAAADETEHPHVRRDERGRPVVGDARLHLHVLAEFWRLGWTLDELAAGYPFLSVAQILGALSYYMDHQDEVDALIRANLAPESRASFAGR